MLPRFPRLRSRPLQGGTATECGSSVTGITRIESAAIADSKVEKVVGVLRSVTKFVAFRNGSVFCVAGSLNRNCEEFVKLELHSW